MIDTSVLYVSLIQVSGTFVALMAGFAVNRYFTNNSERQRYVFEKNLIQPELSRLQELVENQKNARIDDQATKLREVMLDLLTENSNVTDQEIIEIARVDLEQELVTNLVSKIRKEYVEAEQIIRSKLGALIPQPTSEQLETLKIEVNEFNRPIYLRKLREIGDEKRRLLNVNNPFRINMTALDSLSKMKIPTFPYAYLPNSKKSEADNLELLEEMLHKDYLLTSEIETRKSAMKMRYFYIASGITTLFGVIIPTYLLTRRPLSDWILVRNYLFIALIISVFASFWYVIKTIGGNKKYL